MALVRFWRGRPRGLSELPTVIREADVFASEDNPRYLKEALLSVDGEWIRLTFEDGYGSRMYWRQGHDGWYLADTVPAVA